jgi:hypothetical protein
MEFVFNVPKESLFIGFTIHETIRWEMDAPWPGGLHTHCCYHLQPVLKLCVYLYQDSG